MKQILWHLIIASLTPVISTHMSSNVLLNLCVLFGLYRRRMGICVNELLNPGQVP